MPIYGPRPYPVLGEQPKRHSSTNCQPSWRAGLTHSLPLPTVTNETARHQSAINLYATRRSRIALGRIAAESDKRVRPWRLFYDQADVGTGTDPADALGAPLECSFVPGRPHW